MTRIEALDRMPINDKFAHFARRDAFLLPAEAAGDNAGTMRLPRKGLPSRLGPGGIDAAGGNVTRQAYPVIGRPCLGIPPAWLVHGREYMVRKNGKLAFARCGECPVKAACGFIVNERLNANERIREAHREFLRRGGEKAYWSREPSCRRAPASALKVLVRELQAVGFTTVNDAAVAAHYDQRAQDRRQADAERQRAHRGKATTSAVGVRSSIDRDLLASDAKALYRRLRAVQETSDCPRWLANVDGALAVRVWFVRGDLRAKGKRHGATHIARVLSGITPDVGVEALRFRVNRTLRNIEKIEQLEWPAQFMSRD